MDAIKDILSEFIDKKELIKGLFSKIQSAIFLDKLNESNTAFLSQRAHEPYTPCQPKNFEIKFLTLDSDSFILILSFSVARIVRRETQK